MQSLSEIILKEMSIEELYKSYLRRSLIDIEKEIERRLNINDILTIDFLFNNKNILVNNWLQSYYIKRGILNSLYNIPWKIGIIYNYTDESYRYNNISVILGDENYKNKNGQKFTPTWLESNKSKLVLREVVSSNFSIKNVNTTVRTIDPNLDIAIRNTLINNDSIKLTICLFIAQPGQSFQTYDQPLPDGETKTMYPCYISSENFGHGLMNLPLVPVNASNYIVNVTKSETYLKLRDLFSLYYK